MQMGELRGINAVIFEILGYLYRLDFVIKPLKSLMEFLKKKCFVIQNSLYFITVMVKIIQIGNSVIQKLPWGVRNFD